MNDLKEKLKSDSTFLAAFMKAAQENGITRETKPADLTETQINALVDV